MKGLAVAIAAVVVFVAALVAFAPATLLNERITAFSNGRLHLADAQGSVWEGRGALVPPDGGWRIPVAWRIAPLALTMRTLDVELVEASAAPSLGGRLEIAPGRVGAGGLHAELPAQMLAALPGGERFRVGGEISVRADALTLARNGSAGSMTAQWRNARIAGPGVPVIELGTVTASLAVRGNALAGPVTSQGGQAIVSGEVSLLPDRAVADLRVRAATGAPRELRDVIAALGPADRDGAAIVRAQYGFR